MIRHAIGAILLGLAVLAMGMAGCSREEPAKPAPITQNNPLGMPADELNKFNRMGPQQRALMARQLSQMQQRRAAVGTANAPNSRQ